MKKLLLTGLLLGAAGAQATTNFDLWNKTTVPLYFEVGTAKYPPMGKDLTLVNAAGSKDTDIKSRILKGLQYGASTALNIKTQEDFAQATIDTKNQTLILLARTKDLKPGDRAVLITVNPRKDIFLRIKEDNSGQQIFPGDSRKYVIGAQTGPLMGWAGRTERGLPLANIAKQADIIVNSNYTIVEKPMSDQEKELEKAFAADKPLTAEQQKLVKSLEGLGIGQD